MLIENFKATKTEIPIEEVRRIALEGDSRLKKRALQCLAKAQEKSHLGIPCTFYLVEVGAMKELFLAFYPPDNMIN